MRTGFALLTALLPSSAPAVVCAPSALRAPNIDERDEIIHTMLHVSMTRLLASSDGDLRDALARAIADGRGIRQVGCAPADIELSARTFRLRADLLLEGETIQRTILVDGLVSPTLVLQATQCDTRAVSLVLTRT